MKNRASVQIKFLVFFALLLLVRISLLHAQLTLENRISHIISRMTLDEKIAQLHQEGSFNTADIPRLNIPGFTMSDGPHGVRNGQATSFPVGSGLAATWDPDICYQVGRAMGQEFRGKSIIQALGPCLDPAMDPRNGRSPESSSEDPCLNAAINVQMVKGIQSAGAVATIKHFFTEYRQSGRTSNNYTLSAANFMEQYAVQYRDAVQLGGALSVMNAYNLLNGDKCAENPELLNDWLRIQWGFPFYVVSDWGSIWNAENAITAGCDIDMGDLVYQDPNSGLKALATSGELSEAAINIAVRRVLRTKIITGLLDYYPEGDPADVNSPEHQQLCLEAGKKSLVLLKNQENILPLDVNTVGTIAVIGPNANVMRTDATGSSWVTPFYTVTPRQGIENYIGSSNVLYAQGCGISGGYTDSSSALAYARQADLVIFFGGLDGTQEGEGFDRANGSVNLPGVQNQMIRKLAMANPNIVVVLISGGICTATPFVDNIKGLMYGFYPGNEGGNAIAQTLFGDYNPGGKLPQTMPKNDAQLADRMNNNLNDNLGGGYRWFDANDLTPEYAFGYGLSYTTFSESNLSVSPSSAPVGQPVEVSVDITNTGQRRGDEVVQLYLSPGDSTDSNAQKQLRGFRRITLEPDETETVTFRLTPSGLYTYDGLHGNYLVTPGTYTVRVGFSSDSLPLTGQFTLTDDSPKPDLQIANIYTVPPYPLEGDSVIFLATVLNRGTGPSPAGQPLDLTFKLNGTPVATTTNYTQSIPAGGMALICANTGISGDANYWIATQPDTFRVDAAVNGNNVIAETISGNNESSKTITVSPPPPVNLALNQSVMVSSAESAEYGGGNAVDGNLSTRWSSQFSDPQWITVDFGETLDFDEVVLRWETAYGKVYQLQTSNDNSNWTTIVNQTTGSGNVESWEVDASARYLRMYGTQRGTEWGYSLYEIEVYNNAGSSETDSGKNNIPEKFGLLQNYPNPFNPSTTIPYHLPRAGRVKIVIYNELGQRIAMLRNSYQEAGDYSILWDSHDRSGHPVPSGLYFYRMDARGYTEVRKMVLVR